MLRFFAKYCLTVVVGCTTTGVRADEPLPAVYQRTRMVAPFAAANWGPSGAPWRPGFPGFYNAWLAPQPFSGTWYQRPYPDHLIYNNVRSGISAAGCIAGESTAPDSVPYNAEVQGTDVPRSP